MQAGRRFSEAAYVEAADRNLNFVLDARTPWLLVLSVDGERDFVDHFTPASSSSPREDRDAHGASRCTEASNEVSPITSVTCSTSSACRGHSARAPRLTVYRASSMTYAECPQPRHAVAGAASPSSTRCWRRSSAMCSSVGRSRRLLPNASAPPGLGQCADASLAQAQMFRSVCACSSRAFPSAARRVGDVHDVGADTRD